MKEESLHEFYEFVILPQFGFLGRSYEWTGCESIGYDDEVHYFTHQNDKYALLFRDYGGMSKDDIKSMMKLEENEYEYLYLNLQPTQPYLDLRLDTPCKYAHNVTGTFTLIQLKG